jgi:hypothetical protein
MEALKGYNAQLQRLLNDQQGYRKKGIDKCAENSPCLLRDYSQAVELYEVIRYAYACECADAHIANLRLVPAEREVHEMSRCDEKWTFEMIFPSDLESIEPRDEINEALSLPGDSELESVDEIEHFSPRYVYPPISRKTILANIVHC